MRSQERPAHKRAVILFSMKGVIKAQMDGPETLPDASRINLQIVEI